MSARHLVRVMASLACIAGVSGCGGADRSPEAVCDVFRTEGVELHDDLEETARANDPLQTLLALGTTSGRMSVLMRKEQAVAPPDIEPSFKKVADDLDKVPDNAAKSLSNPLEGLGGSLALAFDSAGAEQDVNEYLSDHCDLDAIYSSSKYAEP